MKIDLLTSKGWVVRYYPFTVEVGGSHYSGTVELWDSKPKTIIKWDYDNKPNIDERTLIDLLEDLANEVQQ